MLHGYFHLVTFGCKVNQYESQAIREAWQAQGGTETADPATAHVALVNSCAVTARGERDARNALYRLRRTAPAARCILTGCAALRMDKDLHHTPLWDVLVPPRSKALLLRGPWSLPEPPELLNAGGDVPVFGAQGFRIAGFQRARPVVKVQDGCSHRCTFCIVPLVRGPARSRPLAEVLAEVTALLEAGYGEIMLSGINLHQYGRGMPFGGATVGAENFWGLLRHLDALLAPRWEGRARLRLSSLEPTQLDAHGLNTLETSRLVCPHIHLSLQHASREVLRRMGRGHCRPDTLADTLAQLRRHWPHLGLGADILVGFPGETDAHMRETLHLMKNLGLTYAHVFPYSPRPGTPAATFTNQIPHREKLARAAEARAVAALGKHAFLERLRALSTLHVVLDSPYEKKPTPDGMLAARRGVSEHYAPCRFVRPLRLLGDTGALGRGIVTVRPLRVEKDTLLVEEYP